MLKILPIGLSKTKINHKHLKQNHNLITNTDNFKTQDTISFKSKSVQILEKEYHSLIKNSKLNPVKAFFSLNEEKAIMDGLLTKILEKEDTAFEFISDILKDPRETIKIANLLPEKVGSDSDNVLTFVYNSPYTLAYKKFITEKFENSNSINELLTMRPDWRGEKLLEKHQKIYGNNNFEIGNPPTDLPKEDLLEISTYLKGFMQGGGAKYPTQINPLTINSKQYQFEYFIDGKTNKNVFGIILPDNKKYILKMADENLRSLDAPFALGTLAKIDTYLTANKSRNSAPLLYYNHNKNFLLYEYIEHTPVIGDTRNLSIIRKNIPDYNDLGLQFNDNVGSNNCFLLDNKSNKNLENSFRFNEGINNKEWISIDNDHVTYSNSLHPQVRELHTYLPNGMQICV